MYSYIIGKVTGYDSFKINDVTKVYLYNHIREDENSLYGFKSSEEKDLFLKLINVKGIGPKMAMPLFASDDINKIYEAINSDNVTYLTKFPKIGDKVAKQIILDLKGKLTSQVDLFTNDSKELVEVLESLGYKTIDIKKILSKIDTSNSLEMQIKEALKLLGK